MALVRDFGDFEIRINFHDHGVPHFHVYGPDLDATVAIRTREILAGALPAKVRRKALAWAARNEDLLMAKWNEYKRE